LRLQFRFSFCTSINRKRREIASAPKIFFIDNGIRNQLLNNLSTDLQLRVDKGPLFENRAFSEIYKALPLQDSIKFWRSKAGAEVHFVIEHAGKVYGLEVKSAFLKHPEVSRSAWSFMEAYALEGFAVLNMSRERPLDHERGRVDFLTPDSLRAWFDPRLMGPG
jgi:uncharacterized protein